MSQAVAARDQFSAGGLALLVHGLLFLMLVFGVSWKTLPDAPVYADLWRALPSRPLPPEPLPPEPVPEAVPEAAKPPAPPKPVAPPEAAPPEKKPDPDIALQEKKAKEAKLKRQQQAEAEKKRQEELKRQRLQEQEKRQDAERRRKLEEEMQRAERERLVQEEKQLQARREEARKAAEAKRQAQEKARREMEALMEAELADDLAAEAQGIRQQVAATARLKVVDDYKGRIQLKIKGLLINPPNMQGRPEAVYRVDLLPNGEVVRATLVRSSGQPAYDRAVESAILKASPLPLPPDRETSAAFRDGLELKFRPD